MHLKDKHILVTGAAKRIGKAIAEAFLTSGAKLSAHYLSSQSSCFELEKFAKSQGTPMFSFQADLCDRKSINLGVEAAIAHFGSIDILINSASVFYPTRWEQCVEREWDQFLKTNLQGQFFFAQACAFSMQKKGSGIILNIADVYGEKPIKNFTPYTASKAGLLMMTKNLALEFAPHIRVNAISPGPILPPEHYSLEQKHFSAQRTLLGRWGVPQDIVTGIFFLVENEYITGFNLIVDGGRSIVAR